MYIISYILLICNYSGKIYILTARKPTAQGHVGFLAEILIKAKKKALFPLNKGNKPFSIF